MDNSVTKRFIKQHIELFGKEIYSNRYPIKYNVLTDSSTTDNALHNYKSTIENCCKCNLGNTRNKFVFGSGDPNADLLLIGEGPGEKEDIQGEPFVGRAGELLDKILKAIGYNRRDKVFITNIASSLINADIESAIVSSSGPSDPNVVALTRPKSPIASVE